MTKVMQGGRMVTMGRWTGRETRALRLALRLTVRHFAEDLGVSPRTVSKWETAGGDRTPQAELQRALDTVLERASPAERERFRQAVGLDDEPAPPLAPSGELPSDGAAGEPSVDLRTVAPSESALTDRDPMRRRSLLMASGLAALGPTWSPASARSTSPVRQALEVVTADVADTGDTALECLNELVEHYIHQLAVAQPSELLADLLGIRAYAGELLGQSKVPPRRRPDILIAAGWFSNLLAIASSYLGDHASALVWCIDAERRSQEAAHPEIAGWAMLTRAMIAHYQGLAHRSGDLASGGRQMVPLGTVAYAKLAAQEMRARAMMGDAEGMAQARANATRALSALPTTVPKTGVFSIALAEHPPYTATSLLLSGQLREAAAVTQGIIETAYPRDATGNRESSSYARTLLILGLAEAGLGRVDEAAAAGTAALAASGTVWPTLVLAGKLDEMLTAQTGGSDSATDYHTHFQAVTDQFQRPIPAMTEKQG